MRSYTIDHILQTKRGMIPRWMIDVYLLWLGCRWLCATPNFGDLLLNSATELKDTGLKNCPPAHAPSQKQLQVSDS